MAAALLSRFGTFVTECVRLFVSVTVFIKICKNRTIPGRFFFKIYFRNQNPISYRKAFYLLYSQIWFLFYWISLMKVMTN